MQALGARVRRGLIHDGGRAVAAVQVLERRGLRWIGRGPVRLGDGDQRAALRALARHSGLTVATPEVPMAGAGLIPLITTRHQAIWDLRPDPAQLRAAMAQKWRNRLAAAERAGGTPVLSRHGRDDLAALIAAEAGQRRARRYRALPADFLRHWTCPVALWRWPARGPMRAGMLFLIHGTAATYHIGWAGPEARAAFAHGPMLWRAACDLRARGVTLLDLGAADAANPGLARFKLGTGAALRPLGATVLVLPAHQAGNSAATP